MRRLASLDERAGTKERMAEAVSSTAQDIAGVEKVLAKLGQVMPMLDDAMDRLEKSTLGTTSEYLIERIRDAVGTADSAFIEAANQIDKMKEELGIEDTN